MKEHDFLTDLVIFPSTNLIVGKSLRHEWYLCAYIYTDKKPRDISGIWVEHRGYELDIIRQVVNMKGGDKRGESSRGIDSWSSRCIRSG